jgi:hypothetical protein
MMRVMLKKIRNSARKLRLGHVASDNRMQPMARLFRVYFKEERSSDGAAAGSSFNEVLCHRSPEDRWHLDLSSNINLMRIDISRAIHKTAILLDRKIYQIL